MVLAALAGGFGLAWRFRSRLAGGRGRCGCGRAAPGECPARPGVDLARMSHAKASQRSGDKRNIRTWWPYTGPGEAPTTAASSAREVMPSFGKIRYRWLRTVRCDR